MSTSWDAGKSHQDAYGGPESTQSTQKTSFVAPFFVIILEEPTCRVSQALSKRVVGGKLNKELGGACELRSVWNLRNHPDSWLPSEGQACMDGKDKMLFSFYLSR